MNRTIGLAAVLAGTTLGVAFGGEATRRGPELVLTEKNFTRHSAAFKTIQTPVPPGFTGVYDLAGWLQLDDRTVGIVVDLRCVLSGAYDFGLGCDLAVMRDPELRRTELFQPLIRAWELKHPVTGTRTIAIPYSVEGGFVPLGARRADGSPHPHAGTGYGISQVLGRPIGPDNKVKAGYVDGKAPEHFARWALLQFAWDGNKFTVTDRELLQGDALIPAYEVDGGPLSSAIPDGDDLLSTIHARSLKESRGSCGVVVWRRVKSKWKPVKYTPVRGTTRPANTGADPSWEDDSGSEPSLIRDRDGSLLFTSRFGHDFNVWRSADGRKTWQKIVHVAKARAESPVTIARTLEGVPFLMSNPYCEAYSTGVKSDPGLIRESLRVWQLKTERNGLLPSILMRHPAAEFGPPPTPNSTWYHDHPQNQIVRLGDGKWHAVISYRLLDIAEAVDAPAAPQSGTYLEECITPGPVANPPWRFWGSPSKPTTAGERSTTAYGPTRPGG